MAIILGGCHGGLGTSKEKRVDLWNGKDLTGWKPIVGDSAVDLSQVWRVRDGVIYCSGKPNGYLRTENKYQNYYLHVEWRWPEKPANSGVFVFVNDADRVWPTCIECQLQAGNAGQFVLMNGAALTVDGTVRQNPSRLLGINKKVTCPTDGGRGASLIQWAAIGTKGAFYGRQEHATETVHGGVPAASRQADRRGRVHLPSGLAAAGRQRLGPAVLGQGLPGLGAFAA
jgi:hypothetical protein